MHAMAPQPPRGGTRRSHATITASSCSARAGWVMIAAQALLALTESRAFLLQPPISPPPTHPSRFNHFSSNSARRAPVAATHCLTASSTRSTRTAIHAAAAKSRSSSGGRQGDDESFAEDQRYRRKARGVNLRRDDAGLPSEKVYAPRQSAYGTPTVGGTGRPGKVRPQGEEREVSINNAARLKVAGGIAKGRRLESPDVFLRPMMAKVKEALFSTLMGFGVFETEDARFLDLFSGSGSVGIEALSRGAGHATFVDFAKDCCDVCLRNANLCGFSDQVKAVKGDVMDVLYNPRRYGLETPFDVITVTPPYEEVVYAELVKALSVSDLVAQDTLVVIEYPVELGCMPHAIGDGTMVGLRNRRYGRTVVGVWVYLPSGQFGDMLDSRPEEFVSIKKK
ncbi:unnamed protein product [Ectocarpus sp. CCAP 1310/34]|nr:unnamed protein product [Ectocarpus sp. CCAP 1310/34]